MSKYFLNHKIKLAFTAILLIIYWAWLPKQLIKQPISTVLLDQKGELLSAKIATDEQWRFPTSDSIPFKFKHCILQFEDEYFYTHPGINPVSIFKSLKRNAGAGKIKSGGSTITMQLARIIRGNQSRTYLQKCIEILLAIRIELSYKKNSILNLYCSNAPFGSNVIGLEAASWRYFGRSSDKLSWAEAALLAVLPNAPSLIYPGKNHKRLMEKRNRLLKKLLNKKIIDSNTYSLALLEELPEKPEPLPQLAPHLLSRLIEENGEGKIYRSTLIKNIQIRANEILNKHMSVLSANQIHNAALLISETHSGKIIAYIGNAYSSTNAHENYVDIINRPRSTGSILKPFLYAFLLNDNLLLPNALIEDVPIQIGSYGPKNFDLKYDGLVPAGKAISRSLNVPAVNMLKLYGTAKFHQRLKQLGFTSFTKPTAHYGLSIILGGGEASLWEISSAYASMGRSLLNYSNSKSTYQSNNYKPLTAVNHIENKSKNKFQKNDLLSASSIWYTFNAMTELVKPQDYTGWMQFSSKTKIAWKTGTSFGFRDAWAVGLNPKYTVAVWVGNASGEGRPDLTGTGCAAPLLFATFNILPKSNWFTEPVSDLEKIKVCKQSGFKASSICPNPAYSFFPKGSSKTEACSFHKTIYLDKTESYRVNADCYDVTEMIEKPWFIASPMQEYFYKQHNIYYKPLPTFLPNCNQNNQQQLEIIYPRNEFKIYIPINEKGELSQCIFKAAHKDPKAILYWYLDGNYIAATEKFHQIATQPVKGKHTLSITDNLGETATCKFELLKK
ncbi:MAG: penicillin-binding protein 1C [Sphingobacteriaceae bacterium]|nr:penicillin-binding protein 1C [Sphingobacteriaceae bacterium]